MLLLGVDIVDFKETKKSHKYRDARFVSRVFSDEEQNTILNSNNPNVALWAFWAVKEAAYKIISKLSSPPVFRHKCFRARVLEPAEWDKRTNRIFIAVEFDATEIKTEVRVNTNNICAVGAYPTTGTLDDYLRTVDAKKVSPADLAAWKEKATFPESFTEAERASITRGDSALVRSHCKNALAAALEINPKRLQIIRPVSEKKTQPPYVLLDDRKTAIDITLSHHGAWLAWAFSVPRGFSV